MKLMSYVKEKRSNDNGKYKEIFKLKEMLEEANIPFEFIDRGVAVKGYEEGYQIYYSGECNEACEGDNWVCSVIEFRGSYGSEDDLLEIMGLLTPEELENDSVVGWLTADNVFQRIKSHWGT